METNNGEEELSLSETVFTNNSDELTDNENADLSEHGMSGDAAELFREFAQGIDADGRDFAHGIDDAAASGFVLEAGGGETATGGDVHSMLAQREKDLILAAELGKALLEENEELERKQTLIAKEHAEHIEALEQEKHELRRRLEITEGTYENKVVDLQTELTAVRKELTHQMTTSRLADKDKQDMIAELIEQNQRLNTQLAQASDTTDDLTSKLHHLQKHPPRVRRKTSSTTSDKRTIDELHDEVKLMNSKTRELERRIYSLTEEREALLCSLKESSDRVLMYEKHSIEMQQQLEVRDGELAKVRHMHNAALEELEEINFQSTLNNSGNHNNNNSLFFELGGAGDTPMKSLSSPGALSMDFEEEGDGQVERHQRGREATILMIPEEDDVFEEDKETDKLLMGDGGGRGGGNSDAMKENKYKKVLEEVYIVLSEILWELRAFNKKSSGANSHGSRRRRRSSSTGSNSQKSKRPSEDSPRPSSRTEEVRTQLKEVKVLLQGILTSPQAQASPGSDSSRRKLSLDDHTHIYSLESHIETLRGELVGTQTHIELLQAELDNQDEQMRRKDDELGKLHAKAGHPFVGSVQRQLHSLQDELLSDSGRELEFKQDEPRSQIARVEPVRQEASLPRSAVTNSNHEASPRDEIIKRLQNERDEAISKRNSAEMELTQARLDMMNLDGQLLEAINQKLELSQELDQWQVDIHELLDDRLKQQLRKQELERRKARAAGASTKSSKTKLAALQKKFPFLNLKLTPDK
ncbi:bicaudal D-related protein homolog isoform X2 [Amphiura filiformis]|uniref:bicaudal D-related protein homolog isoform X2 n=1 Tax=Amphiura filiformis TaxID=82378 RepID=UPI003B20E9AC